MSFIVACSRCALDKRCCQNCKLRFSGHVRLLHILKGPRARQDALRLLFLVYYTMAKFHNIQVWRSEVSHFQLLKLNLAFELGRTLVKKPASRITPSIYTINTLYWRVSCISRRWQRAFCYLFLCKMPPNWLAWNNCDLGEVILCSASSSENEGEFNVSCNFQLLGSVRIVKSVWSPKSQPISGPLSLCSMRSLPLSPQPLQPRPPWAPLLLNNSTVIQGHRQENRFCLCVWESVCVRAWTESECKSRTGAVDPERIAMSMETLRSHFS